MKKMISILLAAVMVLTLAACGGMMVLVPGIRKVFHVPDGAS